MVKPVSIAYIGLGANLGDAKVSITAALAQLGTLPSTQLTAQSGLYGSAPIEADGNDYVNAVAQLHTQLSAAELLLELQRLEQQFGRIRSYQNAPRTLDLDLLLYGQECIQTANLQVPHPRLHLRAFALLPLVEIDPAICIPQRGPAQQLLAAVSDQVVSKLA